MRRPTVVLVDDQPKFLATIRELVQVDCDVLAAFGDGEKAVDAVCSLSPDVVVLDIGMPVVSGLDAARRLCELGVSTRIVFLTAMENREYEVAARELGASFVIKRKMRKELMRAIRTAVDSRANTTRGSGAVGPR